MSRVVVIYRVQAFLDVVRRVLPSRFEVVTFKDYQLAANQLDLGAVYNAVLCGLADPAWAIKIFEQAAAHSPRTRLIPIASDLTQLDAFRDQWNFSEVRMEKYGNIGQEWLREHFTVGDIHALFPPDGREDPQHAISKAWERNPLPMEASLASRTPPAPPHSPPIYPHLVERPTPCSYSASPATRSAPYSRQ